MTNRQNIIFKKHRKTHKKYKKKSSKQTKKRTWSQNHKFPWNTRWIKASPFKDIYTAKRAETLYVNGGEDAIGFTQTNSLKSMGRIPRTSQKGKRMDTYVIGYKYRMI